MDLSPILEGTEIISHVRHQRLGLAAPKAIYKNTRQLPTDFFVERCLLKCFPIINLLNIERIKELMFLDPP